MRVVRRVATALTALLLLAGCDDAGAAAPAAPSTTPAAAAGGACQLLDFAVVNAKLAPELGADLAVAAAASQDNTFTCVLQPRAAATPDLILSVSTTTIAPDIYTANVPPKSATPVDGLGAAAYQQQTPATEGAAPAVEVGWLAGNKRIIQLTVHLAPGTTDDKAAALQPKLVSLAKLIDLSSL